MSIKRRFMLYNLMMLIFPLIISLIVFELSTNFFEDTFLIRNENYEEHIEKSSEVIAFARSKQALELSSLESFAKEKGYSLYIVKDNELLYENLSSDSESIVKQIEVIEYDVVYHFSGKVTIATRINYVDGPYDIYFISRENVSPKMTVTLIQLLLIAILVVVFIAVATSNYIVSGQMIKSFSKPLEKLSRNANKIRKGDLDEPVGKPEIKEFNQLYATFDLMRAELKSNIDKNIKYEKNRREMLAGISHDLKTPLTVIQGYSKGLIDGIAKDEQQTKKYVDVIYRKSLEMESLLNQLSIFSNLENKTFTFKFETINLHTFLEKLIKQTRSEYLNKIKINYQNNCKDIVVSIDILQMQRVFDNLVSNSIKYNDNELIIINFVVTKHNNKEVVIIVSDNGIGVSEEEIEHIFENFYRVDESRSTKVEGNGLGLAICKNIIEAHQGTITASSLDSLTITITLPIGEEYGKS